MYASTIYNTFYLKNAMAFHKFSNATLKHFCLWIMMCSLSLYQRYLKYQAHFRGGIWKLPLFKTDKIPRITSKIFKKNHDPIRFSESTQLMPTIHRTYFTTMIFILSYIIFRGILKSNPNPALIREFRHATTSQLCTFFFVNLHNFYHIFWRVDVNTWS